MNPRRLGGLSTSHTWSIGAGIYLFLCGIVTTVMLQDILVLFSEVIGLPPVYAIVILPGPALLIGSVVWWRVIEDRGSYSYVSGALFGLLTALGTGCFWVLQFVSVWSTDMLVVPIVSYITALVLGIVMAAGILAGLPFMYGRRVFQEKSGTTAV